LALDWKTELQGELLRAEAARAAGNEGQARVCARRAAGIAVREYLARRGEPLPGVSAYDLLQRMAARQDLEPALRRAAAALTLRVTREFDLPVEVDLIAEAHRLCAGLVPGIKE
jgi:hypothetical protein